MHFSYFVVIETFESLTMDVSILGGETRRLLLAPQMNLSQIWRGLQRILQVEYFEVIHSFSFVFPIVCGVNSRGFTEIKKVPKPEAQSQILWQMVMLSIKQQIFQI